MRHTVRSLPVTGLPDAGIAETWTDMAGPPAVFVSDRYGAAIRQDEARFPEPHGAFLLPSTR